MAQNASRLTDFHTHIFPPALRGRRDELAGRDATFGELLASPKVRLASVEDLIEAMDEDGVSRAVTMGMGWTDPDLAREVNDYVIDACRRYPDRIIGFGSINPAWGDVAACEVERFAERGLRGIGELHPDTQGFDLADADTMKPVLEVAERFGLVITTHSSEPVGHSYAGKGHTTPQVVMRFIENAAAYPNVKIICAHWGGGLPFYALMPEVRDALSNVWFDTAASPFLYDPDVFRVAQDLVGQDRILLGSDFPLIRFRRIRRQVEQSGIRLADFAMGWPPDEPSSPL